MHFKLPPGATSVSTETGEFIALDDGIVEIPDADEATVASLAQLGITPCNPPGFVEEPPPVEAPVADAPVAPADLAAEAPAPKRGRRKKADAPSEAEQQPSAEPEAGAETEAEAQSE